MSAADRGSRLLVVAVVGALIGCGGSHDGDDSGAIIDAGGEDGAGMDAAPPDAGSPCADPVAPGEYTLAILPVLDAEYYGVRLELAASGTFAGHLPRYFGDLPEVPTRCDGILTSEESEQLTDAINAGRFFCRGNTFDDTGSETHYSDFELRTIDGLRVNRFCGHIVPGDFDPALSALAAAARAPLERVGESGGCMGEPYEVPASTDMCSLWPRPPPMPPPPP